MNNEKLLKLKDIQIITHEEYYKLSHSCIKFTDKEVFKLENIDFIFLKLLESKYLIRLSKENISDILFFRKLEDDYYIVKIERKIIFPTIFLKCDQLSQLIKIIKIIYN